MQLSEDKAGLYPDFFPSTSRIFDRWLKSAVFGLSEPHELRFVVRIKNNFRQPRRPPPIILSKPSQCQNPDLFHT